MNVIFKQSPNYTKGDGTKKIGFILHGTLGNFDGAVEWLCTPPEKRSPVSYSSAHAVFAKDGRVTQLVDNNDIAWHAGNIESPTAYVKSVLPRNILGMFKNPNISFIGLEIEWLGPGDTITEEQYKNVTEYIINSGIPNPVIFCHKELTASKGDFEKADKSLDVSVTLEVRRRVAPLPPITPTLPPVQETRDDIKKQIINLVNKL